MLQEDKKYRGDRTSTYSGRDRDHIARDEVDYRRQAYGGSDRDRREDRRYERGVQMMLVTERIGIGENM